MPLYSKSYGCASLFVCIIFLQLVHLSNHNLSRYFIFKMEEMWWEYTNTREKQEETEEEKKKEEEDIEEWGKGHGGNGLLRLEIHSEPSEFGWELSTLQKQLPKPTTRPPSASEATKPSLTSLKMLDSDPPRPPSLPITNTRTFPCLRPSISMIKCRWHHPWRPPHRPLRGWYLHRRGVADTAGMVVFHCRSGRLNLMISTAHLNRAACTLLLNTFSYFCHFFSLLEGNESEEFLVKSCSTKLFLQAKCTRLRSDLFSLFATSFIA